MESSQKVNESVKILQFLSEVLDASSETISEVLDIPLQTTNRTLSTLRKFNYVAKSNDRKWKLGIALLRIANTVPSPVLEAAKNHVEQLATLSEGAAILAIPRFPYFTVLMERDGIQGPLRLESLASVGYPLHLAPPGIAILSHLPQEQQSLILKNNPRYDSIMSSCEHVKTYGWAIEESHIIPGRHGICSPIFGLNQEVVGSLTIAFPSSRSQELEQFTSSLLRATSEISRTLSATKSAIPNQGSSA